MCVYYFKFSKYPVDLLIITAIPILQKHLQFIVDCHARYGGEEVKPSALEEMFSTSWTRAAISDIVKKGIGHLTQVPCFSDEKGVVLILIRATCYGIPSVIGSSKYWEQPHHPKGEAGLVELIITCLTSLQAIACGIFAVPSS